jgi:signal transduction histidine kinase
MQRNRRPEFWPRLWVQMSLAFGAVLVVTTIGTGVLAHLLRPEIPPEQLERWTAGNLDREFIVELRNRGLAATLAVGVVSALVFGVWMSRRLTKPLNELAEGTQAITARDLTYRVPVQGSEEIRALARSFNEMALALETAERLRRNLLSDVAHELRTPLTVLQGNLRAILDDVYTLDKSEVARLYEQTRHLIGLVNDLHELAQAEAHQLPLNLAQVDLVELAHTAGELLEPLFEQEETVLQVQAPAGPVCVEADEARLMQVLQNLLSNAVRHTPAGEAIHLRVAAMPPLSSASPEGVQGAAHALIEVQDRGDGIDAEHLPCVFDRFYRTDRARDRDRGGAGLGLAIVRAMVEAHRGQVEVESLGPGQGATFRVYLPRTHVSAD